MALAGAVVSKPTAKNTTCLSGLFLASFKASSGEYTIRMSAPSAFASNRLLHDPGTRSMSPNEQKIASGRAAMATALSMSSIGVTHTGQPGPWTSVISRGSRSSRPLLTMVWVWPPQISMMVQGRVTFLRIAVASCSAAFGSRYSLTNFTEFLFYISHLLEVFEHALGFFFVDHADGEADMDENIFADLSFWRVGEADFFANAAKIDFCRTEGNIASVDNFDDLTRDRETHERTS